MHKDVSGRVAVGVNQNGALQVFMVGDNHGLYTDYETSPSASTSWSGWKGLGGYWPTTDGIGVGTNASGKLQVFLVGTDGHVYSAAQKAADDFDAWTSWGMITDNTFPSGDQMNVWSNADGHLEVFLRGFTNSLYTAYQTAPNNGWAGWTDIGGAWDSRDPIAVTTDPTGQLEVLMEGTTGKLYTAYEKAASVPTSWTGWSAISSDTFPYETPLSVFNNQSGRPQLYAVDGAGDLLTTSLVSTESWNSKIYNLQRPAVDLRATGTVGVGINASGKVQLFAEGTNGVIYSIYQVGANDYTTWNPWSVLQGAVWPAGDSIPAESNANQKIQVFNLGADTQLHTEYQGSSGWTNGPSLGGGWPPE